MPKYNYVAMDARGKETKGTLDVAGQNEAIGRVKEMGLFPTKIVEVQKLKERASRVDEGAYGHVSAYSQDRVEVNDVHSRLTRVAK